MPGTPGFPDSYDFLKYENKRSDDGSSTSTFYFMVGTGTTAGHTTGMDDLNSVRTTYMESVDAFDTSLRCADFSFKYFKDDPKTGKYECEAKFIPFWKLLQLKPNQPMRVRINYSTQTITLKSTQWTWNSGAPVLNANVSPFLTIPIDEITLFGARTGTSTNGSMDLTIYDTYRNKVNSDTFLGAAPGQVLFKSASASPRQLSDGTLTNDVEIRVDRRAIEWNMFFNETTGLWEVMKDPSGNPMFGPVSFVSLLT